MKILKNVIQTLGFDYRSLALYRFLMGLVVMADVYYRIPDLVSFYTDVGLVPRALFMNEMGMPWSFSLHFANGSAGFIWVMFVIHFIFGMMMSVGYKTRWATIGAFIMTVSLHNRNWLVNNGGDDILRAVLFISIFLPLSRCFSLDSALRRDKEPLDNPVHVSTWGWMYFAQIVCIYFVSFVLKDHPMWRKDFSAVYYASRLDIFASPIGVWLRQYPVVQTLTTIYTIVLEGLGPVLLVFSFCFGRFWWIVRLIVIALFLGLHMGIIATMWIGVFPWLCLVIWLIFIPTPFWEKLRSIYKSRGQDKLTLYFDGDCRFCEKMVLIIREFFLLRETEVKPTQSQSEINALMISENSWVVVNGQGERFFHFSGMLEVMKNSPILKLFVPIFKTSLVHRLFNRLYKWVASHRQLLSRYSQYLDFRPAKKEIKWMSWVYQLVGLFFFFNIISWNLSTIKKWNISSFRMQEITRWIHLYQEWNMFSPFPKTDNIWVEVPALLSNGQNIELLSGDLDIFSIKDKVFPKIVPNEHWRKFYLNVSERVDYARYYGGFLCRQWNDLKIQKVPDTTLRSLEIIVYSQLNLPNDQKGGITKALTWKHWCFDSDYKKENQAGTKP